MRSIGAAAGRVLSRMQVMTLRGEEVATSHCFAQIVTVEGDNYGLVLSLFSRQE